MNSFSEIERKIQESIIFLDSKSSYNLDRITSLLEKLGNPQEKFKTIHVAGTSGKTSTSYFAASILHTAGYKVGLTVSPHIDQLNERVQIGLEPISEKEFALKFTEFIKILNMLSIRPTYFELLVAFAYWYFAKSKVDYVVAEVGLGGLLDGTNTIKRSDKVSVITDIGLDHTYELGADITGIAFQKAGIIHKGNEVFMNQQGESIVQVVERVCVDKNARLHVIPADSQTGDFQYRNWSLAKKACEYILEKDNKSLTAHQWQQTFQTVVPGRLETFRLHDKTVVLDGAHNTQKIEAMIKAFKTKFPRVSPPVLLAVADSKDIHLNNIASRLEVFASRIIITTFASHQDNRLNSIAPEKIAGHFKKIMPVVEPDVKKAVQILFQQNDDVLLVTGSLYLIKEAKKAIGQIR